MIFCALALDALFGDPQSLPHPVRFIGALIARGERMLWTGMARPDLRNGAILAAVVVLLSASAAWAAIGFAGLFGKWFGWAAAVAVAWTTLAARGLDSAAADVQSSLGMDDIGGARRAIRSLVGRDPEALDRAGLIRATIESVAENCSDGVIAPLFFLFIGGPAAAIAYKAINTLDSMIGYLDDRYFYFGCAAARLDDAANLLPARLTALCLMGAAALLSRRGGAAYAACRESARLHHSPNAGFPESAIAGALGIQLGGEARYAGDIEHRALLGRDEREPSVRDIAAARRMAQIAAALAFCTFAALRWIVLMTLR
jgi:adenosylcobinamide-phosphate synthase